MKRLLYLLFLIPMLLSGQTVMDTLNYGQYPGDPDADTLRNAIIKIDNNFRTIDTGFVQKQEFRDSIIDLQGQIDSLGTVAVDWDTLAFYIDSLRFLDSINNLTTKDMLSDSIQHVIDSANQYTDQQIGLLEIPDSSRIYDTLALLQTQIDMLPHFNDLDTTLQNAKDYADNITVQIPTNTPRDSIPIYDSIAALRNDIGSGGGGAMTAQAINDSLKHNRSLSYAGTISFTWDYTDYGNYSVNSGTKVIVESGKEGAESEIVWIGDGTNDLNDSNFIDIGLPFDSSNGIGNWTKYHQKSGLYFQEIYYQTIFSYMDTVAPVFSAVSISDTTDSNAVFNATLSEDGYIYVFVDSLWSNPNIDSLKNAVRYVHKDSINAGSYIAIHDTIDSLITETTYYVYYAGRDDSLNYTNIDSLSFITKNQNILPIATIDSVGGYEIIDSTITLYYTYDDNGSGLPEGLSTFQWYRADDGSGTNRQSIIGATSQSYVITDNDGEKYLQGGVVPVNSNGSGNEALSGYTGQIPIDSSIFTMYTNNSGTFNPSFTVTSGTLYFVSSDGQQISSNAPSFSFTDGTTKTVKCYIGSVPTTDNIVQASIISKNLKDTFDISNLNNVHQIYLNGNSGLTTVMINSDSIVNIYLDATALRKFDGSNISKITTLLRFNNLASTLDTVMFNNPITIGQFTLTGHKCDSINLSNVTISGTRIDITTSSTLTDLVLPGASTTPTMVFDANTNLTNVSGTGWASTNLSTFSIYNAKMTQASVDGILAYLNTYFSSNTPTRNLSVIINGGTSSAPTGGNNNADRLNLISIFSGAGYTFSCFNN